MTNRKKTSTKKMFTYRVEKAHHAELKRYAIELNNKAQTEKCNTTEN